MSTFSPSDTLKNELERRMQSNPHYSLRAFARDLEMSPSQLSLVMTSRRGLSDKSAALIAKQIFEAPKDRQYFVDSALATTARSKYARDLASKRISAAGSSRQPTELSIDSFKVIAGWYHYALLELTTLKTFKNDTKWIAQQLGITKHQAEQAIQRLQRLELLEIKNNRLVQTEANLSSSNDVPSAAIKSFHKQILAKANAAIDTQSIEERELQNLMISIPKVDLPRFKAMVRSFATQVNDAAEASQSKRDSIYNLSIQLFRLNQG